MASNARTPQFILFGDSLTEWAFDERNEGFGWFLEQRYKDKVHVRCEGQAGYTSTDLLHDFDHIIAQATFLDAPKTLLFTIFLGANDACLVGNAESVPLPKFEANIRKFVETILTQDALYDTKVVLITPPPINVPSLDVEDEEDDEMKELSKFKLEMRRTYLSKKKYAERIMQIADEYEESGRVVGFDLWGNLVRTRLQEMGEEYDEKKLPGCGLYGARDFGEGYFTDGLHLDIKGYSILSQGLYEKLLSKWPQLTPEHL